MRRAASAALAALALTLVGVACGSAKATPGVPHAKFRVGAVLSLEAPHGCSTYGTSSTTTLSAACAPAMTIATPGSRPQTLESVKWGTVLQIANSWGTQRRLQGSIAGHQVFDTGSMEPFESTTVVLDSPGKLTVTDTTTGKSVSLTIEPKPGQKT